MKRFATIPAALGLGLVLLFATTAQAADVPSRMTVQALLLDQSGKAVSGSFDITFSLWDKDQGGNQLWADTQTSVLASQGLLDVVLGGNPLKPILVGTFANSGQVWLQLKVESGPGVADGGEDPLPRRPFSTVGFAFHSQNAVLAANAVAFDGKTYTAVKADMLQAVAAEGYIKPGVALDQSNMPPNGLNEVSNGLLTNQFTDKISSPTAPVKIKDFNPLGVGDSIDFPDIGTAEKFSVAVNISNSDLNGVTVNLYAPNNKKYVLYDKNGPGTVLGTSYPVPTKPNSGDLNEWIGKNPKGKWQLEVIDLTFNKDTNPLDGQINSWSISISTLSTKKVKVIGDLIVEGNLSGANGLSIDGGLTVKGAGTIDIQGDLIIRNTAGDIIFKVDHKTSEVTLTNAAKLKVLDTNGAAYFEADPAANKLTTTLFPPGSRPFLYGNIHDFTHSNWVYKAQATYGHSIGVDDATLHKYVEQVLYGDKTGNIHRSLSTICRANDSNCRTQQVLVAFIKNTTTNDITHKFRYRCTAQSAGSNYAGLAINGNSVWNSSSNNVWSDQTNNVTFPKNQGSVLVLKCGSYRYDQWNGYYMKSIIGYRSDSFNLPTGLEMDYSRYRKWIANK